MKLRILSILCASCFFFCACDLIIPPDRPPESTKLSANDFAFQYAKIERDHTFIGVERIDCPVLQSAFSKYGKCTPKKFPMGAGITCPLLFPGKTLDFACLSGDEDDPDHIPAVYAKLTFDEKTKNIPFKFAFDKCTPFAAGPLVGEPPRYPTDNGIKVCLFDRFAPYSTLHERDSSAIPAGLYVDLSNQDIPYDSLAAHAENAVFNAPAELVLDSRLLDKEQKKQSFKDVFELFDFYTTFAGQSALGSNNISQ